MPLRFDIDCDECGGTGRLARYTSVDSYVRERCEQCDGEGFCQARHACEGCDGECGPHGGCCDDCGAYVLNLDAARLEANARDYAWLRTGRAA